MVEVVWLNEQGVQIRPEKKVNRTGLYHITSQTFGTEGIGNHDMSEVERKAIDFAENQEIYPRIDVINLIPGSAHWDNHVITANYYHRRPRSHYFLNRYFPSRRYLPR